MPVPNSIQALAEDMKAWRRYLHANPELDLECFGTAAFIADRLAAFGVDEVHEGFARTGIVAIIRGGAPGPTIGLRADMDALPIEEATGVDHASVVEGKMHACGHDGHVAMLLGAARHLAETRNFAGRVALIFQPGEEGVGGARMMVEEGLMQRFGIEKVFAMHNWPNREQGKFFVRPGPIMASVDTATVMLRGVGGHGAMPHTTVDPVIAMASLVQALQTVVARNVPALEQVVVSVTQIHTGSASNIIPSEAWMTATIRAFTPEMRKLAEERIRAIVAGQAASFGVEAVLDYDLGYPPTINDAAEAAFAARVAAEIAPVDADTTSEMGAEDFAYMLNARPGAYLFLGAGPGAGLHNAGYDFNDDIAPVGAAFFVRAVEMAQPLNMTTS
ncbi:M20 aminoacylase family protein [Falsirhodobacter sp. 20TX0035]|uniref:M20 aminoacylase family protein n=1 Tax=Falsirhodobacter sp. 20TX0035 TaxID=3022019 RepID=UPI00232EE4DC|nr:M20 aminoacylase family protein [Falsirhodobacter sp. 20TX0035]MDB6453184.1 M20 family metallopeptidase [Falsirhodobacter sp. 20TX0035]